MRTAAGVEIVPGSWVVYQKRKRTKDSEGSLLQVGQVLECDNTELSLRIRLYSKPEELPFALPDAQIDELVQRQSATIKLSHVVGLCFVMHSSDRARGVPPSRLWTPDLPLFHSHRYCATAKILTVESISSPTREKWQSLLTKNAPEFNVYSVLEQSSRASTGTLMVEDPTRPSAECVVGSSTSAGAPGDLSQTGLAQKPPIRHTSPIPLSTFPSPCMSRCWLLSRYFVPESSTPGLEPSEGLKIAQSALKADYVSFMGDRPSDCHKMMATMPKTFPDGVRLFAIGKTKPEGTKPVLKFYFGGLQRRLEEDELDIELVAWLATNYERSSDASISIISIFEHHQQSNSTPIDPLKLVHTLQKLRKDIYCSGSSVPAGDAVVTGIRRRVVGLEGGLALYGLTDAEEAVWSTPIPASGPTVESPSAGASAAVEPSAPTPALTAEGCSPASSAAGRFLFSPKRPRTSNPAPPTTNAGRHSPAPATTSPAHPTWPPEPSSSASALVRLPSDSILPQSLPNNHVALSSPGLAAALSNLSERDAAPLPFDDPLATFEFSSLGTSASSSHFDTASESDRRSRREVSPDSSTGDDGAADLVLVPYPCERPPSKSAAQIVLENEEKLVREREQQLRRITDEHRAREKAAYLQREHRERLDHEARTQEGRDKFARDLARQPGLDDMMSSPMTSADFADLWHTVMVDQGSEPAFDMDDRASKRTRFDSYGSESLAGFAPTIPTYNDDLSNPNYTASDYLFSTSFNPSPASSVSFGQPSTSAPSPMSEAAFQSALVHSPSLLSPVLSAPQPPVPAASIQRSPLHALLTRMVAIDPGRAPAYQSAYAVLAENLVGPDVVVELGCVGLERLGLKAGVAARILMEVKREALEEAGKDL